MTEPRIDQWFAWHPVQIAGPDRDYWGWGRALRRLRYPGLTIYREVT